MLLPASYMAPVLAPMITNLSSTWYISWKRRAMESGGYVTVGDIGYLDDAGYLFICDRKIDMVISGGVNIYPAEIEAVLVAHPQVHDVAVFGIPDDDWGEEVKAVVHLKEGHSAGAEEIHAFLAEKLADYKLPRSVDFVDDLPYNPSGNLRTTVGGWEATWRISMSRQDMPDSQPDPNDLSTASLPAQTAA